MYAPGRCTRQILPYISVFVNIMPIYPDIRPTWQKPEQASVLESPIIKALRTIAPWLGGNDPGAIAGVGIPTAPAMDIITPASVRQVMPTGSDVESLIGALKYGLAKVPKGRRALQGLETATPRSLGAMAAEAPVGAVPAEFAPVGGEAAWNAAQDFTTRNPLFTKGMPRMMR